MKSSYSEQFAALIRRSQASANAHLCDGDATSAMVWDTDSPVTKWGDLASSRVGWTPENLVFVPASRGRWLSQSGLLLIALPSSSRCRMPIQTARNLVAQCTSADGYGQQC